MRGISYYIGFGFLFVLAVESFGYPEWPVREVYTFYQTSDPDFGIKALPVGTFESESIVHCAQLLGGSPFLLTSRDYAAAGATDRRLHFQSLVPFSVEPPSWGKGAVQNEWVRDGILYLLSAQNGENFVYAFNLNHGKLLWVHPLGDSRTYGLHSDKMLHAKLALGGAGNLSIALLTLGTDQRSRSKILHLDATTGASLGIKTSWEGTLGSASVFPPVVDSNGNIFALGGYEEPGGPRSVYKISSTGTRVWKTEVRDGKKIFDTSPHLIVSDHMGYVGAVNKAIHHYKTIAVDRASGSIVWEHTGMPISVGTKIIYSYHELDQNLYGLDPSDGTVLWKTKLILDRRNPQVRGNEDRVAAIEIGDRLYVGIVRPVGDAGQFVEESAVLELISETGQVVNSRQFGNKYSRITPLLLANGSLFVFANINAGRQTIISLSPSLVTGSRN